MSMRGHQKGSGSGQSPCMQRAIKQSLSLPARRWSSDRTWPYAEHSMSCICTQYGPVLHNIVASGSVRSTPIVTEPIDNSGP